jgi:hypothetical protein
MDNENLAYRKVISRLNERAKELNCLYRVHEVLKDETQDPAVVFGHLLDIIPAGWQHPTVCEVRILYEGRIFTSDDFRETPWMQSAQIIIDDNEVGSITVVYTQMIEEINGSQFLPEEQKLLNAVAERVSLFLFALKLRKTLEFLKASHGKGPGYDEIRELLTKPGDEHWKWRQEMLNRIAAKINPERFGVKAVYVIGSVKNATSGPASDIDVMIHIDATPQQEELLKTWMEGWSLCLAEMNYARTGYYVREGLVDLHLVTDEDIKNKSSFATMIGSIHNSARPVKIFNRENN